MEPQSVHQQQAAPQHEGDSMQLMESPLGQTATPSTSFADNRPEANSAKQLQAAANASPQVAQLQSLQSAVSKGVMQRSAAPIQLNKYEERPSGRPARTIGIQDTFLPNAATEMQDANGNSVTENRNVYATEIEEKYGLWNLRTKRVILYDTVNAKQYSVNDNQYEWYTAVRPEAVEPIRQHGIDPNYGNKEKADSAAEFNVRGFNYFGKDTVVPKQYGKTYLKNYKMLKFNLPVGTQIEVDPEIPGGLRTRYHIRPTDITDWG